MPAHYVLNKSAPNQYHFVLKAGNNEVILTSQVYGSKQAAQTGIESCRLNSHFDIRYDKRTSTASQPYFVLKAGNGEIIGNSQMYSSTAARDTGIDSCKTNGPGATLVDNTAE
jgi:uncharacterized protein YegP (UPF0339 family)